MREEREKQGPFERKEGNKVEGAGELLNKAEKITLSVKKDKAKKTSEAYCDELEKELEDLSPSEDEEVVKPSKKRKVTMKMKVLSKQFADRQEEKEKKGPHIEDIKEEEEDQESEMEKPLSANEVSKQFMIEKRLYPFKGIMLAFLASPIRAFSQGKFFKGVTTIRADVKNLFYKGYISKKKHYVMIKGKKVYFRPEVINALYRLDDNVIGHAIFKNPTQQDMQDALARVSWPGTKWDRTPTGKYQLFPHNLNTAANVRLLFCQEKDHACVPRQHHFHGQSNVPLLQYRGDSDEYG
uniref:Protein MNN4-like n=1 Tax=Cucumis melo TaxID=3656 RepID=A0A9I9DM11_CUCME